MKSFKNLLFGSFINAFEWYDYTLYMAFAGIFSQLFFPAVANNLSTLINLFSVFAVAYASRPLGALFFGYLSDNFSAAISLKVSFVVMALSVAAMGLLPTYQYWGGYATLCLLLMRFLQGFALGGGFGSSVSLVVANAPKNRRGFHGSFVMLSVALGIICGSIVAVVMFAIFTQQQLLDFAWRIPFILSFFALFILYAFKSTKAKNEKSNQVNNSPGEKYHLISIFKENYRSLIKLFVVMSSDGVPFYVFCVFLRTYLETEYSWAGGYGNYFTFATMLCYGVFALLGGLCADRFNLRKTMQFALAFIGLLSVATCFVVVSLSFAYKVALVSIMVSAIGFYHGCLPLYMFKLFEGKRGASSSISISYNLSMLVFGGITPIVASLMVYKCSLVLLGAYVASICLISIITLYFGVGASKEGQ